MSKELRIYVSARVDDDVLTQAQQIAAVAPQIEAMRAALAEAFGPRVKVEVAVVVPKPRAEKEGGATVLPLEAAA